MLQGFPDDWSIAGTKAQQFKQVGNAVPAVFGELLGRMLNAFLSDFPASPPVRLDMPSRFNGYIDYTKRDHARNAESRVVHKSFENGKKALH